MCPSAPLRSDYSIPHHSLSENNIATLLGWPFYMWVQTAYGPEHFLLTLLLLPSFVAPSPNLTRLPIVIDVEVLDHFGSPIVDMAHHQSCTQHKAGIGSVSSNVELD